MTARLALLRHGRTAWNRAGRIQGRSDIPLDDDARAELSALSLPPEWQAAALWSSPLARAAETARLVAGRAPQEAADLSEMDWGRWEGQRGLDLKADSASGFRDIGDWGWNYRPPGGESPADVRARLASWLAGLQGDAVAVCHIGVMRVILAQAHGWTFRGPAPFQIKRNRLYTVAVDGSMLRPLPGPVRLIREMG